MPIDSSHPIGQFARFVLRPSESLNEIITGTVPGGAAGTTEMTSAGLAFVPSASATTWAVVQPELDPFISGSFTVHWYGILRDNTSQTLLKSAGPTYGCLVGTGSFVPGQLSFYLYAPWSAQVRYSNVVPITDGSLHTLTARYNAAATPSPTVEFFLDNNPIGGGTFTIDPGAMGPNQTFAIQGLATKSHKTVTVQDYVGALSNSDIATLVADPFAIFTKVTISGTVAILDDDDALSFTGIQVVTGPVSGTVATTDDDDAVAATGSLTNNGVVNITDDDDTLISGTFDPYGRLKGILQPLATHTWVRVNTDRFFDCTIPAGDDAPGYTTLTHAAIVVAWSSFAWDHLNGNLILWGGGHANYGGNEIYIWSGSTGMWRRGSLPSRLDSDGFVPNKDAPQSSHTYSNQVWLKNNQMFVTFGGAAAPSGGPFQEKVSSGPPIVSRRVAPWVFDLALEDSTKVGGATGTGWNTTVVKAGSNAWYNRRDMVDGTYPIDTLTHINGATVYVEEAGKDVVYFTMDGSSGFPYWYRCQFGDIRNGGRDTCAKIAETWNSVIYEGFGVYDSKRGMFYRNGVGSVSYPSELSALHVATATGTTRDTAINVVDVNGAPFIMAPDGFSFGAAYDEINDRIYLWNGHDTNPGTVYYITIPAWDITTGWASTTWVATKVVPAGATPNGNFQTSVLGKFRYVTELGAMVALDKADAANNIDPGVWLFKT
jgi:hypothetical protein